MAVTLTCDCGQKLNAPGAIPGRVGKCPRCGSLLKMDEVPGPSIGGPGMDPEFRPPPDVGTYQTPRIKRQTRRRPAGWSDGLVPLPPAVERSLVGSWDYPLRASSGLGLLLMIPPLLWFGTVPLFILIPMAASGSAVTLLGLILLLPELLILALVLGHTLLFLGDVVVTSSLGEVNLPRPATWNPTEIARGWARWSWAGFLGLVVGGTPALLYWVDTGDVDWFDQVVLIDLILPGLAYAQMVLVMTLIGESVWAAANPVRVFRAIRSGGWKYIGPCLVTGVCLATLAGTLQGCLTIRQPFIQVVAFWLWLVAALYLSMVSLRVLGLFCYREGVLIVGLTRRR